MAMDSSSSGSIEAANANEKGKEKAPPMAVRHSVEERLAPSEGLPEPLRRLGFAFSTPTLRDGIFAYLIGKVGARLTARNYAKPYCHCELYFEDDRCFGITSLGMHFYKRTLALDEYTFYAIDVPESNYRELLKLCGNYHDEKKAVFSPTKALLAHITCLRWVAHEFYPKHYTYCSELLARVLRDSGIFPHIRVNGATPNDIAESVLARIQYGLAYPSMGPSLTAHHNDERV